MSYNQQLPFAYDRLMSQPASYRLDMPPFVPNMQVNPQLQHLLPVICAMMANELSQKAQMHSGRTFLFNQMTSNNYANSEFATCVATALDLLALNLFKQLYRTPEEGLSDAVVKALSIHCSLNFQNFPQLQSVTSPDIVNDAIRNIQSFHSLSNEIANFKNRPPQGYGAQPPQYGQPVQQGYGQPQYQQPMYPQQMQQPMMINPSFSGGNPGFNQPMGGYNAGSSSGLFSSGNQGGGPLPSQQVNTSGPVKPGKWDYLKPAVIAPPAFQPIAVQPVQNVQQMQPAQILDQGQYFKKDETMEQVNTVRGDVSYSLDNSNDPNDYLSTQGNWLPSRIQPYPPTINPYKQKIMYRHHQDDDGKPIVTCVVVNLTKEEMDRKKHTITTIGALKRSHIPEGYNSRMEALEDSVEALFKISGSDLIAARAPENLIEEEAAKETQTHVKPNWGADNFIESAVFEGRLAQKQSEMKDTECSSFRVYTILAKPVICEKDHTEIIQDLAKSKTFRELASKLSEIITISKEDTSLVSLCLEIDKLLTAEVNSVIRNRFSIPKVSIDSFMDDINDVPDYLLGKFGEMYKRIFLEFQKNFIPQVLGTIEGVIADTLTENLAVEPDNGLVVNYLAQNYSITYVNIESDELGVEIFKDCGSAILSGDNPLLYRIIDGIFKQEYEFDQEAFHHLIVLNDNEVYEVNRGLIRDDFFTIYKK